eukprot:67243_1
MALTKSNQITQSTVPSVYLNKNVPRGSYVWNIDPAKILQSEVGDKYESEEFEIAKLRWLIKWYPNGEFKNRRGSSIMYIELLNMPNEWKSVLVQHTIQCIHTYYHESHTGMSTLYNINTSLSLESYVTCLSPISMVFEKPSPTEVKELSIQISLQIIQIISVQNENVLYHEIFHIEQQQTIKWNFKNTSTYGIAFFVNEIKNQMFYIDNMFLIDESSTFDAVLCLELINLPSPKVQKMKIKCTISCHVADVEETLIFELGKEIQRQADAFFFSSWFFDVKYNETEFESVTWEAVINILEAYDANNKTIPLHEWNQHDMTYDYDSCFLQSTTKKTKSVSKFPKSNDNQTFDVMLSPQLHDNYKRD